MFLHHSSKLYQNKHKKEQNQKTNQNPQTKQNAPRVLALVTLISIY